MTEARPEILLKTDKKTIVLEIETESKFVARAMGWDETGHIIGRKYRDQPRRGRWLIVKMPPPAPAEREVVEDFLIGPSNAVTGPRVAP